MNTHVAGGAMQERMQRRLTELVRLAEQLARDARPARARRLECLRLTGAECLWQMCPTAHPHDPTVLRLAEQLGDSPALVSRELTEFFRLDLKDYSEHYADCHRFFASHHRLGREVVGFIQKMFPEPEILFLEHAVLCGWHPTQLEASEGIIIEGTDYGEQDDRFCQALDGYLVSCEMAFESEVEMLAASFYDRWLSWDELWDRHYGWSEHWGETF